MLRCLNSIAFLLISLFLLNACSPVKKVVVLPAPSVTVTTAIPVDSTKTDGFFEDLLAANPQYFDSILAYRKERNVQIMYTQIDRGANGMPALKHFYFNVNPADYFYPASVVKFPVSLLALQRLNELKEKGIDKNSTMITEAGNSSQTAVYNDPTTPDGRPTIAHYIKKIMMVSDNDAFNRLYEFLGQQYINAELQNKGYKDVQVLHRLEIALAENENRQTNPIRFLDAANKILYEQQLQTNTQQYAARNDSLGKGFIQGNNLVNAAMDFSKKNRVGLEDLHNILISLVFPQKVNANQRFNLSTEDRNFLLKYMSQLPTESNYPPYASDSVKHWSASGKYLLLGGEQVSFPDQLRIFNKTGGAYGHLLDVAYIVDYKKGVEFFLSAVIYCNSDGILNDDKYDYKTIGLPFMKNLGQVIYNYETQRPKKYLPDFSDIKFNYDKP